ncbi:alanine:cation symporter family protein, partial [Kocuria sabuli]
NRRPAQEGFVAAWEPFIDSVVICTMTALAVIVTGQYLNTSGDGVGITTAAFATVNSFFPYLLTVCVVLFAFSTILSYSYYGKKATGYLFGDNKIAERLYDLVWVVMIVVGAAVSLDTVIRFSDAMFFLMTVPNLLGVFLLSKVIRREIFGHREDLRTGQLPLVAHADRSTIMGNRTPAPEAGTTARTPAP